MASIFLPLLTAFLQKCVERAGIRRNYLIGKVCGAIKKRTLSPIIYIGDFVRFFSHPPSASPSLFTSGIVLSKINREAEANVDVLLSSHSSKNEVLYSLVASNGCSSIAFISLS